MYFFPMLLSAPAFPAPISLVCGHSYTMSSLVDQEKIDALVAHVACAIYEKVEGNEVSPQLKDMLQEIVLSPKNASNSRRV